MPRASGSAKGSRAAAARTDRFFPHDAAPAAQVISSRILSLAGPLLTHLLDRASGRQPHLENWLQIARALGLVADVSTPWLPVPEAPEEFQEFVRTAWADGMRVAIVHAGGRLPCMLPPGRKI